MANDCLVTRLKRAVDNYDLSPLNGISFKKTANEVIAFGSLLRSNPAQVAKIPNSVGNFLNNDGTIIGKEKTVSTSGDSSKLSEGLFNVVIPDKNNLTYIDLPNNGSFIPANWEDMYYLKKLNEFTGCQNSDYVNVLDVSKCEWGNIITFKPRGVLYGNIENLKLQNVREVNISGSPVTGDVKKFASVNLNIFVANASTAMEAGTLEDFVAALKTARSSQEGSIATFTCMQFFTLGGEQFDVFSGRLEWTEHHITVKDGSGNVVVEEDI